MKLNPDLIIVWRLQNAFQDRIQVETIKTTKEQDKINQSTLADLNDLQLQ